MERLTSNKQTSDMNMLELAHNSCYADETAMQDIGIMN